jgi:transcription elongation GreA/GreB family factor
MVFLEKFEFLTADRDYKEIARLFDEYTKGELKEPGEFLAILKLFKDHGLKSEVGGWIEKGLRFWRFLQSDEQKYAALKIISDLQTTNSPELLEECRARVSLKYADHPNYAKFFNIAGLREGLRFESALACFELLVSVEPGAFVYHTGGWGVGEVMEVSIVREEAQIEFENLMEPKPLSFTNACNHVIPLPKDHFLSRRFGAPDDLEAFAKSDPAGVLRLFLRSMGPRNAAEIKEEFLDLVIPEEDWTKWWSSARARAKKDPLIDVPDQLSEPFALREKEIRPEEQLYVRLEKIRKPSEVFSAIYAFVRDFPAALKAEGVATSLLERIESLSSGDSLNMGEQITARFIKEELSGSIKAEPLALEEGVTVASILEEIEILSFKKRFLLRIKEEVENWQELFLDLLITAPGAQLKDFLLEQLLAAGALESVKTRMRKLALAPIESPHTFFWFFQKAVAKDSILFDKSEDKLALFEALFALLYAAEMRSDLRDLVKKIHALITLDRFKLTRDLLALSSKAGAEELLLLASKCQTFADHEQKIFQSLAEVEHKSIAKKESAPTADVIWMTREGYLKVQEKIKHLANVEMVDNAREIEEARSHGDLRENAEFKFAQERRARLQTEMKQLSDQLSSAAMLGPDDVDTQVVSVGGVVKVRSDGKSITYTILGPVEADTEKNILSNQSQLACAMIGRRVGETFTFKDKKYEVVSLSSYFEGGAC